MALSSSGTDVSGGGDLLVMDFLLVTLGSMEDMEPVVGRGGKWFLQSSCGQFQ